MPQEFQLQERVCGFSMNSASAGERVQICTQELLAVFGFVPDHGEECFRGDSHEEETRLAMGDEGRKGEQ